MRGKAEKKRKLNIYIIIGLGFFILALLLVLYNVHQSDVAGEMSQKELKKLDVQIDKNKGHGIKDTEDLSGVPMPTVKIDGHYYIGKLIMKSIHRELPVMESWSYPNLKISPCRFSGSIYDNNLVIAGHNFIRHFSPIVRLNNGDIVEFVDVYGKVYKFAVCDVEILKPYEVERLKQSSNLWDLSLFTCTLGGRSRYVVRCKKIQSS